MAKQQSDTQASSLAKGLIIFFILLAIIVVVGIYLWQQSSHLNDQYDSIAEIFDQTEL